MTCLRIICVFCMIFTVPLCLAAAYPVRESLGANDTLHVGHEPGETYVSPGFPGNAQVEMGSSIKIDSQFSIPLLSQSISFSSFNRSYAVEQYALILVNQGLLVLHDAYNKLLILPERVAALMSSDLKDYCRTQVRTHESLLSSVEVPSMRAYCNLCQQIADWPVQINKEEMNLEICRKIKTLQLVRAAIVEKLGLLDQSAKESLISLYPCVKAASIQLNLFTALLQSFNPSRDKIEELCERCEKLRALCGSTLSKILKTIEHDAELDLLFSNMMKQIEKGLEAYTDLIIVLTLCKGGRVDNPRATVLKDCIRKAIILSCKMYLGLKSISEYIDSIYGSRPFIGTLNTAASGNCCIIVRKDYPLTTMRLQIYKQMIGLLCGDKEMSYETIHPENMGSEVKVVSDCSMDLRIKPLDPIEPFINIPYKQSFDILRKENQLDKHDAVDSNSSKPQSPAVIVPEQSLRERTEVSVKVERKQNDDLVIEPVDLTNITNKFMDLVMDVQGSQVNFLIQNIRRRERIASILYGAPGVGKTAVAQVLAKKLQQVDILHGDKPRKVYYINIARCRNYFKDSIQTFLEKTFKYLSGQNAIIILDEIDAAAEAQEVVTTHTDKGISGLVDTLKNNSFIAIANKLDLVPSLIKSRLTPFVEIIKPDKEKRIKVLQYYLWQNERKISHDCLWTSFIEELANETEDFSIRDIENLIKWAEQAKFLRTQSGDTLIRPADFVQATKVARQGLCNVMEMWQKAKQVLSRIDDITRNPLVANIILCAIPLL